MTNFDFHQILHILQFVFNLPRLSKLKFFIFKFSTRKAVFSQDFQEINYSVVNWLTEKLEKDSKISQEKRKRRKFG